MLGSKIDLALWVLGEQYQLIFRGYNNTDIVLLEQMELSDQMKLIHCTDVLVGVQGAGLQWSVPQIP